MREDVLQRFLRKLNKKCGWETDDKQFLFIAIQLETVT